MATTHLDTRKVEFAQHENDTDNRTYRTGSVNDKEQRVSRFRRLTTGSLRYKNRVNQMPTTTTTATTTSTTKTNFTEPVHHSIDPLEAFFNSDTEISDSGVPRLNDTSYLNNARRPKRYRRSGRSPYETPNYSTALGPLREKHKLTPLERIFLEAAERGDKSTLIRCLSFSNSVNVNCVNILGRTAIQIAVDNENTELVELLLDQPGIEIGDAILYAIQEGVYRIVEMLIDHPSITKEMLGTSWTTQCIGIGKREEESHDFPADISPVMLAAICNQFEILQLLINRGARIEEPHKSSCSCEHCHRLLSDDPLKHTLQRINTYRALASPAWISLTSPDPILTAFELSSELLHLASRENEFKETFLSLCEQCRKYACDLLDLCRGTGEVVAVLSKGTDSDESCSDASSDESDDNQTAGKMHNLTVPSNHISTPCYSPNCHCHQTNSDNGNMPICNQSDETENDWRELLERSNFSRKRHHRRCTAWNHPTYSCSKFNQALSIESQHSICDDSASTTNLHPSTSKSERLNYSDNSMNYSEHLQLPVDQTTSYTLAKLPSFVTRDFKDSHTHFNPNNNNDEIHKLNNTSRKRISNEDCLPTILNTSEGCSSIFFERKRNSFDWESPTSGFNQRLPSNTVINTSQSKHELYERNSFNNNSNNNNSNSNNQNKIVRCCYQCCCLPSCRCRLCSKTSATTERDINLNRNIATTNTTTTTVRRFDCDTHEPTELNCIKQQRKFYSFKLDRLKLAIKHEQKKFVAHPHCQHLLTTLWYDQLPGWRKRHPFTKLFLCFCFIIALPVLAPTYLIHPHGCVGQLMRSPLIKFINHSASFAIFIFLLLIASTDTLTQTDLQIRSEIRGPDPNVIEMLILWWVIGFVWSEMKQIWEEGLKAYVRQWWNWLDFLMLGLYLTTVALRVVAVLLRKTNQYGTESLPRNQWPPTDPTLLSEALFSIAHIFSFARIIFLFQINEHLGPLQISLGNMLIDITKFIFIFLLVISSFACGLHQLYYYYLSNDEDNRPRAFSSLVSSYRTLFWHLFGSSQGGNFEVTFVNKTSGERERMESARNTMVVGEILLLIYHAMAIIVLVNMLIAMMSNSFQTIQNHADTEWKFARSKLWVGYFDEGSTLPPPLNTIISPKSIIRFLCGIYHLIVLLIKSCRNCKLQTSDSNHSGGNHRQNIEFRKETKLSSMNSQSSQKSSQLEWDIEIQETGRTQETLPNTNVMNKQKHHSMKEIKQSKRKTYYQTVMRRLVRRYIHQSKKTMRQDGVNEDDLLEIKQDISSLRFELREDRKREIVRAVCQLETLKQELVDELGKQSTILQNATIHPQTSQTTLPTTSIVQTSMIIPSTSSSTYPKVDDLTDYRRKLYKTKPSIPTSVIDSSDQANIHYSTKNVNTGQQQLHHLQSTSSDSKIKEGGRKKYSLNYDKEPKDIYKDLMQLASINDIPIDVLKLNERNNRIATKGLYIDDWNQFKNEMKNELKEELSALLNNRSVVLDNQQLNNNTSNSSNNNSSYQNVSSIPNENRSNIIQSTNQTKYSSRKTSASVNTTHSTNILRKYSKQSDSSVNPNNNNRVNNNNNNDRLKLLHTRYSENVIIDLASSTPVTGVSGCSTSVLPGLKTPEGIVSTTPMDTMMSSSTSGLHDKFTSSSHENNAMKSIMNTSTQSTILSAGGSGGSSGSMNSRPRRQIIDLVSHEQKSINMPENYATFSENVEKND